MLKNMANVLNEFLYGISKGFADAAFATYSRRRSTVREDIDQSFGTEEDKEGIIEAAYKDSGSEVSGSVDLSPKPKAKKRRSGLKEL